MSQQGPRSSQRPSEAFKLRDAVIRHRLLQGPSGSSGGKRGAGRQMTSIPAKAKQGSSGREGRPSQNISGSQGVIRDLGETVSLKKEVMMALFTTGKPGREISWGEGCSLVFVFFFTIF